MCNKAQYAETIRNRNRRCGKASGLFQYFRGCGSSVCFLNFIRMPVVSVCGYRLGILLLRTQYTLTGHHTSSSMCAGVPQLKPAASCEQVGIRESLHDAACRPDPPIKNWHPPRASSSLALSEFGKAILPSKLMFLLSLASLASLQSTLCSTFAPNSAGH